jgi:hypothetical protein
MKNEKKLQILQFGFCWPILVEFISETIRDKGNMSYAARSSQFNKCKEKNPIKIG